jgi:hypothetical protein
MQTYGVRSFLRAVGLLVCVVACAQAQQEAGNLAALQGTLQIERGGVWQTGSIGVPILVGDRVKTGATDRARLVFRDESLLDIGPSTEIGVETFVFDPGRHRVKSVFRLVQGAIRAQVGEYYTEPGANYEIETPSALVSVHGTEFIVRFHPDAEVTEVIGVNGEVNVAGRLAVIGGGVSVGPQLATQVRKGGFPTAPERMSDNRFRQDIEGLQIVGTGRRDGLNVLHPLLGGRLASAGDVPQQVLGPRREHSLTPKGTLPERLSPDVYTNTQPLLDYQNTPPGQVPPGGVTVQY